MSNRIFVKPALNPETGEPLIVRDPHSYRQLLSDGDYVNESTYWIRRIQQGDVILIDEVQE